MKSTQNKIKMYMANVEIWGPNATYIPLTGLLGFSLGETQIQGLVPGVTHIFRYQHVGITNVNASKIVALGV